MKNLFVVIAFVVFALLSCKESNIKGIAYQVDEAVSEAAWKGSARDHFHIGSFKVTGSLTTKTDGIVNSGDFIIPISSIQDYDLTDPIRQQLLDDLKSANFFNLALHPTATFHLAHTSPYHGEDTTAIPGANYLVAGDFTMVGQTHPLSFPAKISITADSLLVEAEFNLDRTKWGMDIYSDTSKPLYIYPDVKITLTVQAGKLK